MRDYPVTIIEDAADLRTVQSRVSVLLREVVAVSRDARTLWAHAETLRAAELKDHLVSLVADLDAAMLPAITWAEQRLEDERNQAA